MSRCFPYPPPGYTPRRGINEALIDSIKLQKEDVEKAKVEKALADKAKAERKKEKKDKKERKEKRREEKKEKKKSKEEAKAKQSKLNHDASSGRTLEHGGIPQKQVKDDTEQLEKSNITEEHGEPSQVPSYSSDSTQSGKRKRPEASPPNASRAPGGNILRIRLPSQKNMKHEISRSNVEQHLPIQKHAENLLKQDAGSSRPQETQNQVKFETRGRGEQPSTSGRADEPLRADQKLKFIALTPVTQPAAELPRADQKLKFVAPTPVTRHDDTSHVEYVYSGSSSEFKKKRKVADKYRDLIENWNPPSMFMDTEEDDWLSVSKKDVSRPEKVIASAEKSCSSSSSMWPQACFLPEANIYALPYAIPF